MLEKHAAVSPCNIGGCDINPSLQKRDRLVHCVEAFSVQQRHQPELSTRLLRLLLQPTLIQCFLAQSLCTEIALVGANLITPNVSRELIEQQHECQRRRLADFPVDQPLILSVFRERPESFTHRTVKFAVTSKPLPWFAFFEPEAKDIFSEGRSLNWHCGPV